MSKKYTIVIPSMNGSKYLKHAIDSVLLENSKNFQLVVSINHSTDSSYEMLKDYKDDRLKDEYIKKASLNPLKRITLENAKERYAQVKELLLVDIIFWMLNQKWILRPIKQLFLFL